jgi:thioredoxin-like negative regulator of GroEL
MQAVGFYALACLLFALPQDTIPQRSAPAETSAPAEKSEPKSYAEAFAEAQLQQRPLVVVVTATWCPPCQVLKTKVLRPLEAKRGFEDVILAYVDMDQEPALAKQLVGQQGIPQVIVFEKNADKWAKRNLSGFQELTTVQEFIRPRFSVADPALRIADRQLGSLNR